MLVEALKSGGGDMLFYAFDLLYLDGFDLREDAAWRRARRRWPSCWPTPAAPAACATATTSRATVMRCSGTASRLHLEEHHLQAGGGALSLGPG